MTVILENYTLPEKGVIELNVQQSFEINITAVEAQQQVKQWLREEISYLLSADLPDLVIGEGIAWQVPAWIGFPHTGRVAVVGWVMVDVTTGKIDNQADCKREITRQAERIASQQPPYHSQETVPDTFLPKNIPSAPTWYIKADGSLTSEASSH